MKSFENSPVQPTVQSEKPRLEALDTTEKEGATLAIDYYSIDRRTKTVHSKDPVFTWRQGEPEPDKEKTKDLVAAPRWEFTKEQVEKAREEMHQELVSREIEKAAKILRTGFGRWLAAGSGLEDVKETDFESLNEALNVLTSQLEIGNLASSDGTTLEKFRKRHQETIDYFKKSGREPSYYYWPLAGVAAPKFDISFNEHGIAEEIPGSEIGINLFFDNFVQGENPEDWGEALPAIRENINELVWLGSKLSKITAEKAPFASHETFFLLHLLDGSETEKVSLVRRIGIHDQGLATRLSISSLFEKYCQAKLATGIAETFEKATGFPVCIDGLDEIPDARNFFVGNWWKNADSLPKDLQRKFEKKYQRYFDSFKEYLKAPNSHEQTRISLRLSQERRERLKGRTLPDTQPDEPETYEEEH